jgi:sulfite exporter TauE/SafE
MTALVLAVLGASLLGSLHCAGMCGAFVAVCTGAADVPAGGQWRVQSAYHGGRLVTYAALGALAGAVGAALDLTGGVLGIQRAALAVAGAGMVAFGVILLLRLAGARVGRVPVPGVVREVAGRGHAFAFTRPPVTRALLIGLLSTLLPCGWLYAFAVTAAGTGSAPAGALVMAVFWSGTLPVLVAVGAGVRSIAGPLRRHVPYAAALLLVVVGIVAIGGRFRVPALEAAAAPADLASAARHVHAIDHRDLPCCEKAE